MKEVISRYVIGLLLGIVFAFIFPNLVVLWIVLCLFPISFIITEIIGGYGFGSHWHTYRFSVYLTHTGVALCVLFGVLFGSGNIGRLLIKIGTLIS